MGDLRPPVRAPAALNRKPLRQREPCSNWVETVVHIEPTDHNERKPLCPMNR
jgi:hypothetical protein